MARDYGDCCSGPGAVGKDRPKQMPVVWESRHTLPLTRFMSSVAMTFVFVILIFSFALSEQARATVYWANGGSIGRVNLDGSFTDHFFIGSINHVEIGLACGVAVNDSYIFWADQERNAIGRATLDGSERNYSFITGADEPCGVTSDATHIYWANRGGNSIGRARLDGTEQNQSFISGVSEPCGVAVNDTFIYWASMNFQYIGRALLASGIRGPNLYEGDTWYDLCGVAVDKDHIYWGGFGDAIGRADLNGADPDARFIVGLERPCGLTVDAGNIYWSEQLTGGTATGRIGRANRDGTAVKRDFVTDVGGFPCGVAIDSLSFQPIVAQPVPTSNFTFGEIRHNRHRGSALLAVNVPAPGDFRAQGKGLNVQVLSEGVVPKGGGHTWLRISPSKESGRGRQIGRFLRRRGRALVEIKVRYAEPHKYLSVKAKRFRLIRDR
jgi:virginiamycin B lyase